MNSEERYKICQACPEFKKKTKQCGICHCFMPLKVKVSIAACPAKKW